MNDFEIIGSRDSHDRIKSELSVRNPSKVLDVPTGRGGLAFYLKEKGWDVHCADIDPGHFKIEDIPFTQVNLNKKLPFQESSFDVITCVNGIHRVLFPEQTIMEFYRVLKPGGLLYLNVNNYSSISKRIRFLVSGSLEEKITVPSCEQTILDPEAHVRSPLMYPRINHILVSSGFEVTNVFSTANRLRHIVLSPIAWLIKVAMLFAPRSIRTKLRSDVGNQSGVFPGGLYLLVVAKKK